MNKMLAKKERTEEEKELLRSDAKKQHAYQDNDHGYWLIKGAEQAGDYVSSHQPVLAYCCGTFSDAVEYALAFEWWTYWSNSSGGSIQKIEVIDLDVLGCEPQPYFDEQTGVYRE